MSPGRSSSIPASSGSSQQEPGEFNRDADQYVPIITGAGDRAFSSGFDLNELANRFGQGSVKQVDFYRAINQRLLLCEDVVEGPRAFAEKRDPVFVNRWPSHPGSASG